MPELKDKIRLKHDRAVRDLRATSGIETGSKSAAALEAMSRVGRYSSEIDILLAVRFIEQMHQLEGLFLRAATVLQEGRSTTAQKEQRRVLAADRKEVRQIRKRLKDGLTVAMHKITTLSARSKSRGEHFDRSVFAKSTDSQYDFFR